MYQLFSMQCVMTICTKMISCSIDFEEMMALTRRLQTLLFSPRGNVYTAGMWE